MANRAERGTPPPPNREVEISPQEQESLIQMMEQIDADLKRVSLDFGLVFGGVFQEFRENGVTNEMLDMFLDRTIDIQREIYEAAKKLTDRLDSILNPPPELAGLVGPENAKLHEELATHINIFHHLNEAVTAINHERDRLFHEKREKFTRAQFFSKLERSGMTPAVKGAILESVDRKKVDDLVTQKIEDDFFEGPLGAEVASLRAKEVEAEERIKRDEQTIEDRLPKSRDIRELEQYIQIHAEALQKRGKYEEALAIVEKKIAVELLPFEKSEKERLVKERESITEKTKTQIYEAVKKGVSFEEAVKMVEPTPEGVEKVAEKVAEKVDAKNISLRQALHFPENIIIKIVDRLTPEEVADIVTQKLPLFWSREFGQKHADLFNQGENVPPVSDEEGKTRISVEWTIRDMEDMFATLAVKTKPLQEQRLDLQKKMEGLEEKMKKPDLTGAEKEFQSLKGSWDDFEKQRNVLIGDFRTLGRDLPPTPGFDQFLGEEAADFTTQLDGLLGETGTKRMERKRLFQLKDLELQDRKIQKRKEDRLRAESNREKADAVLSEIENTVNSFKADMQARMDRIRALEQDSENKLDDVQEIVRLLGFNKKVKFGILSRTRTVLSFDVGAHAPVEVEKQTLAGRDAINRDLETKRGQLLQEIEVNKEKVVSTRNEMDSELKDVQKAANRQVEQLRPLLLPDRLQRAQLWVTERLARLENQMRIFNQG